jgi:hypothetical protein
VQQPGLITAVKRTYAQRGIKGFYSGCTAVVIGNAVKAGVRFTTYDQFKSLLKDKDVRFTLCTRPSPAKLTGRESCRPRGRCWPVLEPV